MKEKISIPGHGDGWEREPIAEYPSEGRMMITFDPSRNYLTFSQAKRNPVPELQTGDIVKGYNYAYILARPHQDHESNGFWWGISLNDRCSSPLILISLKDIEYIYRGTNLIWERNK